MRFLLWSAVNRTFVLAVSLITISLALSGCKKQADGPPQGEPEVAVVRGTTGTCSDYD